MAVRGFEIWNLVLSISVVYSSAASSTTKNFLNNTHAHKPKGTPLRLSKLVKNLSIYPLARMRAAMAGQGSPTGGVKLCPMMTLAVRVLGLSLALCVAVSSGASGPSVNHVPTHGPDYRLSLSGELISYDPVTVTV